MKRRTQRAVVVLATVVGLAASAVFFAGPASAYTPLSCQTATWSSSSEPAPKMSYYAPGSFWKWGYFYVSDCRRSVNWDPGGYRTDGQGDVYARIRTYNSNGNTLDTSDWKIAYGHGATVKLAGMLRPGTRFTFEIKIIDPAPNYDPDYTGPNYWPLGQGEF